jgi:hypothetical protein
VHQVAAQAVVALVVSQWALLELVAQPIQAEAVAAVAPIILAAATVALVEMAAAVL